MPDPLTDPLASPRAAQPVAKSPVSGRSIVATSTGGSVSFIIMWIWNDFLVRRYDLPPMTPEVGGALTLLCADLARLVLRQRPDFPTDHDRAGKADVDHDPDRP